jgi:hypothetical protein
VYVLSARPSPRRSSPKQRDDKLMCEGKRPRIMNLGGTVRISVQAADAFRRQAEKAPKAHRRGVAAQAGRRKAKPAEG